MGLNDVMARLKEPKATQPTPTEQGLILSRLQLDRITEALRIAKKKQRIRAANSEANQDGKAQGRESHKKGREPDSNPLQADNRL